MFRVIPVVLMTAIWKVQHWRSFVNLSLWWV